MAKKSKIARNEQRKKLVEKYAERRRALKQIIVSPTASDEERHEAFVKLSAQPRDASASRVTVRCVVSGRPRGNLRRFGLSRIAFRELALAGHLPGVTKSSW